MGPCSTAPVQIQDLLDDFMSVEYHYIRRIQEMIPKTKSTILMKFEGSVV